MNSTRKSISLLVASLLPFGSPSAGAAGLGDLVVRSTLGEPLRAEVQILRADGQSLNSNCFSRADHVSNDDLPWLYDTRLRLEGDRLIVVTRNPVNHPIAMLGLTIGCGNDFRRDYTILLQPPKVRSGTGIVPLLPASEPQTAAITPAPRASRPARTEARPAPRAAATDNVATPPNTAKVRKHDAVAPRGEPPRHDRLILGGGLENGLVPLRMSLALANPPAEDDPNGSRQQLRQEQRTLSEIDERIAAQLEINEKIKRMEEYQALLKEKVAQLDALPPGSPARPVVVPKPAAPVAPPTPAATTPPGIAEQIQQWGPPLGGILALLAGGGALIWMRRRREANALDEEDIEPTTQPEFHIGPSTTSTAAEKKSAPLPPARNEAMVMPAEDNEAAAPERSGEWAEPTFAPAHPIPFDENVDEQDSALELAEIMMSFGRTQGAAETLADYIRNNPRQAVRPWLKLLEVYHVSGMRAEFEVLTRQLNKTFNVKMVSWNDFKNLRATPDTLEQLPHVVQRLQELWGTQEAQVYIHQILRDNRNGTRQGFPLAVVEELLLLLAILDEELGPYKPPSEPTLEEVDPQTVPTPSSVFD